SMSNWLARASVRFGCVSRFAPPARPTATSMASRPGRIFRARHENRLGAALRETSLMYRYDEFDHDFVKARVAQFSDQVERRLAGEITEDQFKPLRLMNGVYLQLHAYMLRIAVPYGTLNSKQLRMLGHIARKYDKGYGHFTTRQNI